MICFFWHQLGDKRTLYELFRHEYRDYTIENIGFQQFNHDIHAKIIQTVYVYPHSNAAVLH